MLETLLGLEAEQQLPILTVVPSTAGDLLHSLVTFTTSAAAAPDTSPQLTSVPRSAVTEQQPLDAVLRGLAPVSLRDIPLHMLSVPVPRDILATSAAKPNLEPRVPSLSSADTEDFLDSLSCVSVCSPGTADLPLYSHPAQDWSKMAAGGRSSANEMAASESSLLDQSWDETQTLPLFEPTLDFESLMDYD